MSAAAQYDMGALLETAGARPRGNRHDCPKCGGLRTVTHSDGAFYCHRCQWKGNAGTLAHELGLARRLSGVEYRELRQNRERADRAARVLYERVKAWRFELLDELHRLNRLELRAHDAGLDHPATLSALALVYGRRPGLLAELVILEDAEVPDLIRFMGEGIETRAWAVNKLIEQGGLWIERDIPCHHCTIIRPQPEVSGTCPRACCCGPCRTCNGKGVVPTPVLLGFPYP